MNHLSAIANAPTLVQEIARQVSSIATLIGKVAHAAISYLVATLQAVPPLLPLMIVVVAGVTISAIIIRNVLYPDSASNPQDPPTNPQQTTNDGSSVRRSSSNRQKKNSTVNQTRSDGDAPSITRKRNRDNLGTSIKYPPTGRIKSPINRSSGSDSGSNVEFHTKNKPYDKKILENANSFTISDVYEPIDSEEEMENDLIGLGSRGVNINRLNEAEKEITETNSQTLAIKIENDEEDGEDDENKVNETTLTRTPSTSIEAEIVNEITSVVSRSPVPSEDEEDDKTKLPTRISSKVSIHETELQPLQEVDEHSSLVHSDNEDDNGSNEDHSNNIIVSTHSSFSATSSVAEPKVDENKKSSNFRTLFNKFEFGTSSKKGDQLMAPLKKSNSSSASTTRSENGDLQVPKFSLSRAAFSLINGGSTKSTTVASTIPKPLGAATTDNIPTKTPNIDITGVKKRFQGIAAKLKAEKEVTATANSSTSQPKIKESKKNESDLITEDWLFKKDDSKDLNVTTNDKLSAVSELDETASVASNDNARDVETT